MAKKLNFHYFINQFNDTLLINKIMLGMTIMKSYKSTIFDIIMYIATYIFCMYWILDNVDLVYIYLYSIIIGVIIIYKIKQLLFLKISNKKDA
ncbi:hypothetical protein BK716_29380 [Bacillus thuringiensis serovar higo]|uniref:Uncharacterized protein n=1 Tax=Bacillus thuringiensis subsp. higo TaxID=132266 RepID=A0A9X6QK72_BACUH|nr:hypothetical protein BK716_29380 [Bacillus thuringiensis serovar higo]